MKGKASASNTQERSNQSTRSSNVEQKDVKAFLALKAPTASDLKITLTQAILAGEITPAQADVIYQKQSAMRDLKPDPVAEEAQNEALGKLRAIASNGGLDDADRAKLTQIYDTMTNAAKQKRAAITEGAAARGVGGSNLELMDSLSAAQGDQQSANRFYTDVAGEALTNRREALKDVAAVGSTIEQNRFAQGATKAAADDEIERFNTANTNTANENNAQRVQTARAANVAAKQAVADKNTDIKNAEAQARAAAEQQAFEDAIKLAAGQSGAYSGSGTSTTDTDTKKKSTSTTLDAEVSGGISDERLKEDIEEVTDADADAFLDKVTGHKFKFKKNVAQPGANMGVMAQDLEGTPQGDSLVHEEGGVKMVDQGKLAATATALIGNLHKRIRALETRKA